MNPKTYPDWLDNAVFYEIYPQSFKDSNSDGIGDFKGIMEKLDYIQELGCTAIWMNPCFESPFGDAGYCSMRFTNAACTSYSILFRDILPLRIHGLRNL